MAHVYARPHHMLQTEEEVLDIVEDDPSTSTREIARQLCLEWPSYVREWHKVESKMKDYELCSTLRKNLTLITLTMAIIATVEHALINISHLKECLELETSVSEAVKVYYVKYSFSAIFAIVKYSLWKGIFAEVVGIVKPPFGSIFKDSMVAHLGTTSQFGKTWGLKRKMINFKQNTVHSISDGYNMYTPILVVHNIIVIELTRDKPFVSGKHNAEDPTQVMDKRAWNSVRRDYLRIYELCELSNSKIAYLILVSYSTNLYYVLIQLFGCMRPSDDSLEKIYLFSSLTLLLVRLTCICIFGSNVHDEWNNICFILKSIRSSAYNLEVERFVENAVTCELVLTGKSFFKITRGLLLKIAGAIVTYELVIIQFSMETLKKKLD
ncbi:hypothetical protein NQ317_009687 [Molorchus minor]|uniref:Gustatory receptor n=1 Tax=Molorchus minor TaxID=1323400 RepID=A0ABQ9JGU9_9CUCU|nr:hypothetical protein NQ317_009687 [Molorchus minor]